MSLSNSICGGICGDRSLVVVGGGGDIGVQCRRREWWRIDNSFLFPLLVIICGTDIVPVLSQATTVKINNLYQKRG